MVEPAPQSELREHLEARLQGEVRFDPYTRSLYSTDASNHQVIPLGVVLPRSEEDLFSVVESAAELGVPILPRGGGTSLSGAAVGEALILDCSTHLAEIYSIDPEAKTAEVAPGVVCAQLNAAAAQFGLMYGPDPASADRATFGGMLGTNATGAHSIRYGMTADHVIAVETILADGSAARLEELTLETARSKANANGLEAQVYRQALEARDKYVDAVAARWPQTWRRSSGYSLNYLTGYTFDRPAAWYMEPHDYPPSAEFNLAPLICGSEGTLAVIRRAEVRLVPKPARTTLVVLSFASVAEACDYTPAILETEPAAVELIPRTLIERARAVPAYSRKLGFVGDNPEAMLVVEYTGRTQPESNAAAEQLGGQGHMLAEEQEQADLWSVRKAGLGLLMSVPGDAKPLTFMEDVAVPIQYLSRYVREVDRLLEDKGTYGEWYAHASAGCLHMRPLINLKTAHGVRQMREIADTVVELAIEMNGSVSGEHGDGLSHTAYNQRLFGSELTDAFRELKNAFDPLNILNPGKVVEVGRGEGQIDSDLRYGPDYRAAEPETVFAYRKEGSFTQAVEACTGVGICRKAGGVMCPSFQATRMELHSTRGRANALRGAISGGLPQDALTSRETHEILGLCLECKGCKSECPTEVDMARLKAEFLAKYQAEHGVPLRSRLFGEIAILLRAAQPIAPIANRVARTGAFRWALSRGFGVAQGRVLPKLSKQTFSRWFRAHQPNKADERVVLFLDTFTEFNNPSLGEAAVTVLEAAGCEVELARNQVCCGRPMISKGLLDRARENALKNVRALAPHLRQGATIVGLEPSCLWTLRDEYLELLPDDPDAIAVAKAARLIEEYLVAEGGLKRLRFNGHAQRILLHNHCHTKSLLGSGPTLKVLQEIGSQVEEIASGCCGMAGSFGYESEHHSLSEQIGELVLFPAVRAAGPGVTITAPGMSCRTQIKDGTGATAVHPVELLAEALAGEPA